LPDFRTEPSIKVLRRDTFTGVSTRVNDPLSWEVPKVKKLFVVSSAIVMVMVPSLAFAHPGPAHIHGLTDGFLHPLTGFDHILAMVAVGLLAAQLGGRALWITPLSFMALMAVGAGLCVAQVVVPFVEVGIALSIITLGTVLLFGIGLPTVTAAALVGFFAIFHGYAHGAEMPSATRALSYGAGFVVATGLLHLAGVSLGVFARRAAVTLRPRLFRLAGGIFTVAGIAALVGAL
jgi:urease accessory protein